MSRRRGSPKASSQNNSSFANFLKGQGQGHDRGNVDVRRRDRDAVRQAFASTDWNWASSTAITRSAPLSAEVWRGNGRRETASSMERGAK